MVNRLEVIRHLISVLVFLSVGVVKPARSVSQEVEGTALHVAVRDFLKSAKGLAENEGLQDVVLRSVDNKAASALARWEGVHGDEVFVVVGKRMIQSLGGDAHIGPAEIKAVSLIAFNELLNTSIVVECFSGHGLDDRDILKAALQRISLTGVLKGVRHEEGISGGFAVGYAVVDADRVRAAAGDPVNVRAAQRAYLQIMHAKVNDLINAEAFEEAVELCNALRARRVASGDILLSHAKALHGAGKKVEASECLRTDLDVFVKACPARFLERVGDLALEWGVGDVARDSFRAAAVKLLESESVQ